ncbi:MAG: DUF1778 domain-containing protein [Propionibacteriaceae bacterium]|jgi:uncharacterized protein (DUF1778 family)|nr:DUF1778 domain-containing protein [Propionibacteriaceae bacterium]
MSAGTLTRSRRLEARLDPDTDDLITKAAAALGESRSAFVTRILRDASVRVLGRADLTLMPDELFNQVIRSLDVPDEAPGLEAAAADWRAYRRQ